MSRRKSRRARELAGSVVVITGASSGFGRAAAREFAGRGSRLVLAARGEGPLLRVREECETLGASAVAMPTDVRDERAVQALALKAAERFGRIDVWVNNAGVIAYGRFEETPAEVFRGVIETNLMGQVHGARAVLPIFRRQGGGGVLINMSSVWGRVTTPEVSAYVTSKFAVRAFSECLRQELRDVPGIDVLPPAFEAGNYEPRSTPPSRGRVLSAAEDAHDAYAVHGGWKSERRGQLTRAFFATLAGMLKGLVGTRAGRDEHRALSRR